jgi:glucoamylase
MLPEQDGDGRPPSSGTGSTPGRGTFGATPLALSHAQCIRLALRIDAGKPVERPWIVACRCTGVCERAVARLTRWTNAPSRSG